MIFLPGECNTFDDKSTLAQVMAWCSQAITWANVDQDLYHHMTPLGYNVLNHSTVGVGDK